MILILFLGRTEFDSRSRKFIAACQNLKIQYKISDISLQKNKAGFISKFLFFSRQTISHFLLNPPELIISTDIFSLPIALFFYFVKSVPFVFDARELNSEVAAFESSKLKKRIWGTIEKIGFRFASELTTVNQSLRSEFESRYHRSPEILFNYPHNNFEKSTDRLRNHFAFNPSDFIWIFQGGIQKGRGTDDAIQFISSRPESEKLVFIGESKSEFEIPATIQKRIFHLGEVKNDELIAWTSSADAGLILIDSPAKSYQLSLPNKFFEFIFAEIPFLTYDLKEISALVSIYHCGIVSDKNNLSKNADLLIENKLYYKSGAEKLKQKLMISDQISSLSFLIRKSIE